MRGVFASTPHAPSWRGTEAQGMVYLFTFMFARNNKFACVAGLCR
jgi:hypothetical protein